MPSLAALLGLVAIAGYQNRDKIGEFVKNMTAPGGPAGGLADTIRNTIGSGAAGGSISGGLGELVDHFRKQGQGEVAQSWVNKGPNAEISDSQLEKTLGPDLIGMLEKQTGLPKDELLARLSKVLPEAVDKMTPEGRLPA
jgi:uncharacterized protein YidB (DUF937 family)